MKKGPLAGKVLQKDGRFRHSLSFPVIPAQAGRRRESRAFLNYLIFKAKRWTSALAGVTAPRSFYCKVGIPNLFQHPAKQNDPDTIPPFGRSFPLLAGPAWVLGTPSQY